MQIYLARNNEQAGPYSLEQVNQMLASGQVVLTDLAWHEGMREWKPLGDLTNGQLVYQPPFSPFQNQTVQSQSEAATTSSSQQNKSAWANHNQPARSTVAFQLASVNKRVLAKIIDNLIIVLPFLILTKFLISERFLNAFIKMASTSDPINMQKNIEKITQLATAQDIAFINGFSFFCIAVLIMQIVLLSRYGQTLGKKIMNIKIVDDNSGLKAPVYRTFLIRELLFSFLYQILFPVILLIDFGFIFSERRRTLHDRLAKTLVVDAD